MKRLDVYTSTALATAELGTRLRQARKRRSMTALVVAATSGIHYSRLSRIERGQVTPRADEIQALLQTLELADTPEAKDISSLLWDITEGREGNLVSWRFQADFSKEAPEELKESFVDRAGRVSSMRWFEPLAIPGVLQTPAYARAAYVKPFSPVVDVDAAVRSQRHISDFLYDTEKQFDILMHESSFLVTHTSTNVMAAQIAKLANSVYADNVSIGVIPGGTELPYWCLSGFILFGNEMIEIDPSFGVISGRSRKLIGLYSQFFEELRACALYGDDMRTFLIALSERMTSSPR
jgi:transcriptional regulator with XRE-family HTH domain